MLDFKDTIKSLNFDFLSMEDEIVFLQGFTSLEELKSPENAVESIDIKSLKTIILKIQKKNWNKTQNILI